MDNEISMVSDEIVALKCVDAVNADLRARNEQRLYEVKKSMGAKYVLHPDNSPKKNEYKAVLQHTDRA